MSTEEYEAKRNELMADPDHIYDALGPNGNFAFYPESINRSYEFLSAKEWSAQIDSQSSFDTTEALKIAQHIDCWRECKNAGDGEAQVKVAMSFMKMMSERVEKYTKYQAEL